MASGQTTNYGLNQWAAEDPVLRTDFNQDNAKLDAALSQLSNSTARKGNCQIVSGTYVGTGTCRTVYTSLEIGFAPKFILVLNEGGSRFIRALSGTSRVGVATSSNSAYFCNLEWTETGLRWINTGSNEAGDQLNQADMTYRWLAIG